MARRITDAEIRKAAKQAGIPYSWLVSVVGQESGGRTGAVSPAGARGVAQLMPGTARALEQRHPGLNTRTPYGNLLGGAYYLKEQYDTFGSLRLALAAYNAGPGAVKKYGGVPPYSETRNYVKNIMAKIESLGGGTPGKAQPGVATPGKLDPGTPPSIVPGTPAMYGPDPLTEKDVLTESLFHTARGRFDPQGALQGLLQAKRVGPELITPATDPKILEGQPPSFTPGQTVPGAPATGANPSKWVKVPPRRGQWPGPGEEILGFVANLAKTIGKPLPVWDTSTHSRMTTSGRVSAHTSGHALDIPAAGRQLTRMGRLALIQAGMPRAQAMKVKGGLFNIGGYQIIFNTTQGGDHYDHLHVGVRRH